MYAIIETGGKQYKVSNGDIIKVEKLDTEPGKKVKFENVLAISDDKALVVGKPYVEGKTVEGKVVENGKDKKVIVFKYKPKKDSKTKQGHRQPYTVVEITSIGGNTVKASKAKKAEKPAEEKKAAKKAAPKKQAAKKEAPAKEKKEAPAKAAKATKVSASMKKDELIQFAKDNGIKVDPKAKKADIIAAINDAK